MELFVEEGPGALSSSRAFRSRVLGHALSFALFVGGLAAVVLLLGHASSSIPWIARVTVVPLGLVLSAVLVLAVGTTAGGMFAALLPTNWLARLTDDELELNLRGWRLARPGDEALVARLHLREATALRRVTETWTEPHGDLLRRHARRWIELEFDGVDTAPLARAVDAERTLRPRATTVGSHLDTRHHHDTVVVPRPGRVWVEWSSSLFRDLGRVVPVRSHRVERFGLQPGLAEHLEARLGTARRAA